LKICETAVIANGILVGVGGALAFMAKPTTAFVLAMVTPVWLFVHPLASKKGLLRKYKHLKILT